MRRPAVETAHEVPFLDLGRVDAPLAPRILEDIEDLIASGRFVNGPAVAELERAFSTWVGAEHCVGTASGLDALRIALIAAGVGPGDEVVVPAQTFVATVEAVTQAGATPVVADISDADYCLDAEAAAAALTERTRALLPVDLFGQLADFRALGALAGTAKIDVFEDACQAHGASRDGIAAGTHARAAAFSFYPGKNLGAMGDAGALVTDDAVLADTARALREHGQRRKYEHELEGFTARLDTIQALVLLRKMPHVDAWNVQRRAAAGFYLDALAGVGDLRLPPVPVGSEPVWHLFVVRTERPDALADHLRAAGVHTGRHYPQPVHLTPAYARLGYAAGTFPVAEELARTSLSLPIFPGITEAELSTVVDHVERYFRG
jgi:dTDP-3-amino-3,4,6-trideoxy-alpha-D-glucose transaminase